MSCAITVVNVIELDRRTRVQPHCMLPFLQLYAVCLRVVLVAPTALWEREARTHGDKRQCRLTWGIVREALPVLQLGPGQEEEVSF